MYIGKTPTVGNFQKCDALTASATADYTLQVSSTNVVPESVNHMIVSLNGVIQEPGATGGFTVSGSTLSFASALTSNDTIDFVILLGNVLDIGTPSDATVSNAKLASDLISGETDIGGAIADADLFLLDDGAGGTLRKTAASRIKTYAGGLTGVTTGSGNVTISNGNLILGTSGKGIDFSATGDGAGSMTGELLDDYEEGTFTMDLCPSSSMTWTQNTGWYRKVGNMVYFMVYMVGDTYSSGGRANICGLPYTSTNYHADARYPVSYGRIDGARTDSIGFYPFVASNSTYIACDGHQSTSDGNTQTNMEIWDDSTTVSIGGCYLAD